MYSTKLRGIGNLHIESALKDGAGIRVARDFLFSLVTEFAKQSSRHIDVIGEAPFIYRERQLHSILAPSLSRLTNTFLMEMPVKRNWAIIDKDSNDSHGWIDYWCYFRNLVFLLEIKHSFLSSRTCKPTRPVQEAWTVANTQLDVIEKDAREQSDWSKGAFRVAIHIITVYETIKANPAKSVGDMDLMIKAQKKCMELEPNPNWVACWCLHPKLTREYQYLNTKETYPGILFVARVSEIVRK